MTIEMLGVRSMTQEWHGDRRQSDSVVRRRICRLEHAKMQGAGKMRYINGESLWLQETEVQTVLDYAKIKGEENPTDGLTKHVRQVFAEMYSATVNLRLGGDRAKTSLQLAGQV